MYWIFASERNNDYEVSIDGVPPLVESLNIGFNNGVRIKEQLPVIKFPFSKHVEEVMTDNIDTAPRVELLVNHNIKTVFDRLDIENIQYFPTRLIDVATGAIYEDYLFANIIGQYACVNFDDSELELYDDATQRLMWLVREAEHRKLSGVQLKR